MRLYRQTFYLYRIVSYRKTEIWKTVDWLTIILYVVLVVAGWFSICGASYEFDNVGLFDPSGRPGSQLMWMGLSVGLIFVLLMLESEFFDVFAATKRILVEGKLTFEKYLPEIRELSLKGYSSEDIIDLMKTKYL